MLAVCVAAVIADGAADRVASAATVSVDVSAAGAPFSPGVRGQAVPALSRTRGEYWVGDPDALSVVDGSSIRGVAGGLEADTFDWRTRNNSPRQTTLDYLRYSRDFNAELFITANVRGLVQPDPVNAGKQVYSDTSISTLAGVAGDWVRYTNRIAQTYHQGDTISDARDSAILNSLKWNTAAAGDVNDLLPRAGEAPLPKVTYWEIGNEPRVSVVNAYSVTNGYTFLAPPRSADSTHKVDYRERYAAITGAMRAEDPTIRVGPCLVSGQSVTERGLLDSILRKQPDGSFLPVNFISYHPYEKMNLATTAADVSAHLRSVYTTQKSYVDYLRGAITANGRDPNSVELVASETNVSDWRSNDTPQEADMAHALGTVETVFSHARLGLKASHYWVFPAHRYDGTKYPVYRAYEALRDHMGDQLLSTYVSGDLRLYTTKDSTTGEVAFWGMNFSESTDASLQLDLSGLSGNEKVTLWTLGSMTGKTSLFSSNLASDMAGGPSTDVAWTARALPASQLGAGYTLNLPAATLSLLIVQPVPEPGTLTATAAAAVFIGSTRRRRHKS